MVALIYLFYGYRWVPPNCFAVVYRLDKFRSVLNEGLQWAHPAPIETLALFSARPFVVEIECTVNTKEEGDEKSKTNKSQKRIGSNQVTLRGFASIVPDLSRIPAENGKVDLIDEYRKWVEPDAEANTTEDRQKAMKRLLDDFTSKVRSQIAVLGGQYGYDVYIDELRAIETLINSVLRLEKPAHHLALETKDELGYEFDEEGKENVPPDKRIAFYHGFHDEINRMLKEEKERPGKRSPLEEKYGIDIQLFSLEPAVFSEEMKKANEKVREAEQKLAAVPSLVKAQNEIAIGCTGVPPVEALDAAQLILGQNTVKDIHAVRGMSGGKIGEFLLEVDAKGGRS